MLIQLGTVQCSIVEFCIHKTNDLVRKYYASRDSNPFEPSQKVNDFPDTHCAHTGFPRLIWLAKENSPSRRTIVIGMPGTTSNTNN